MNASVETQTKIVVKSETHNDISVESADGGLLISQDNDRVFTTPESAVALGRVLLQQYGAGFQPVEMPKVDYTA